MSGPSSDPLIQKLQVAGRQPRLPLLRRPEQDARRRPRARLDDLSAQIVGMPLLTQDKTWWRFHEESALLSRLLEYDYQLLFQTDAVGQKTRLLTADDWQAGMAQAQFNGLLGPLDSLIYGRQQLLSGM